MARNIVIMGAAGKDFHVFNTCYRGRKEARVVAFTATQIPNIDGRSYPAELAGEGYPQGIPIHPEAELPRLIRDLEVAEVVFAYSDVPFAYVEERRRLAEHAGARFSLAPVDPTMLRSSKPVVAITAVRTGCGKSQTTRRVAALLKGMGKSVVAVRHPMPYGDLNAQKVQRFAALEDLARHKCTVEEMEEYEPHIAEGTIVYAGVDYEAILRQAETEADVILWDGGNNDIPFYAPTLWVTVLDPHRPGHELSYYPGKENFLRAHVLVINKVDSADPAAVQAVLAACRAHNPSALVIQANSPVTVSDPAKVRGKRVVVVEDGPTLTHGEMTFGAGVIAARRFEAAEIVDPRPYFKGEMEATRRKYPRIGALIPAMGYSDRQLADLKATLDAIPCDAVLIGTPIDLSRVIAIRQPAVRVHYRLEEITSPGLEDALRGKLA